MELPWPWLLDWHKHPYRQQPHRSYWHSLQQEPGKSRQQRSQLLQPFEASQQLAPLQRKHSRHFKQPVPQSSKLHLQPPEVQQPQQLEKQSPIELTTHSNALLTLSPQKMIATTSSGRHTQQTVTRQVLCRQPFCGWMMPSFSHFVSGSPGRSCWQAWCCAVS